MVFLVIILTLLAAIRVVTSICTETVKDNISKVSQEIDDLEKERQQEEEDSYRSYKYENIVDKIEEKNNKRSELEEIEKIFPKVKIIAYGIVGLIMLVAILCSSVYTTNEQEIGFVSTFGKNTNVESAGIHFKAPFISEKYIYDGTTKGMAVGYDEESNNTVQDEALMITKDFNLVNTDFYMEYRIVNAIEYKYGSDNPEGILKNIAQSAIRNVVGQEVVDSVMTTGKTEIEAKVFEEILKELENHQTGLSVVNVSIQDVEPPTKDVDAAFKNVENVKQTAEETINKAHEYNNTNIPDAEADAEKIIKLANAAKTERINAAKEEVAKFEALYKEYSNNPETVKNRLYYEALSEILPNMEIIIGEDSKVIYVNDGESVAKNSSSNKSSSDK